MSNRCQNCNAKVPPYKKLCSHCADKQRLIREMQSIVRYIKKLAIIEREGKQNGN